MREKIRGVNLGGWLVLEKWMTPNLFEGTTARDETDFSRQMNDGLRRRLLRHRETYITREDIAWIAGHGLNTLRLPVPHWMFGDKPPYMGCVEEVKRLLGWATEFGLDVMIDLHCAPGCQNGFDNGGIQDVMEWHKHPENIDETLRVIDRICQLCKPWECVRYIQLLNEPHWDVPIDIVKDFYLRGYEVVRKWYAPGECTVVMHDSFRTHAWEGFMADDKYQDILMDAHFYQFQDDKEGLDYFGHAKVTLAQRPEEYGLLTREFDAIVGEWSLGYPLSYITQKSGYEKDYLLRGYAANQLAVYENSRGWIFWSYKVESDMAPWSYRQCVENGWLPDLKA